MSVILVTGGAGFIGSHIVDALIEEGHTVRVLDTLEPQVHGQRTTPPDYLNPKADFYHGSIDDPEILSKVLPGIDVLFHEAALVGVGQSMYDINRYVEGNSRATAFMLEYLIHHPELRPSKLIVASSMSIYGEGAYQDSNNGPYNPRLRPRKQLEDNHWEIRDTQGREATPINTFEEKPLFPTSIYAVTKRDHEEMCLSVGYAYRIPTVALRYFNVYGPRQALSNPYTGVGAIFSARLLNRKPPIIFEDGKQTRDFVHVSDIVQGNLLAMKSSRADYEAVNIGTGRPTSILQIAELLSTYIGFSDKPLILGQFREGDIRHCYADITKAKTLLRYEPRVSIEQGIPELVGWVEQQKDVHDGSEQATEELRRWGLTE